MSKLQRSWLVRAGSQQEPDMRPEEWSQHDATALAGLIREGLLSAEEAREAALSAIDRVNEPLRAVVLNMAGQARAQTPAAGPFCGVPMVVKDMDGFLKGVPCTYSTPFLKDFVPDHDSALLGRLRSAGFVFVAKTNCPELGIMGTTEPQWRGPTHNPWDLGRSPGGSSGGSAALVAARAVPVGHGGDGGGSLRIPAAATGLVGHKCSRGLLPFGPEGGEGWGGYVSQGVLTRSMRDAAAIYDLLVGADEGAPYAAPALPRSLLAETERDPGPLRVALCTRSLFGRETDPEHKAAAEDLGRLLVDLGHRVEEAAPEFDRPALVMAYLTQVAAGTSAEMADFERWTGRRPTSDSFEPATWFLHQLGQLLSAAELQRARDEAQAAGRSLGRFFSRHDVLLTPTVAHPPVLLGELALKPAERFGLGLMRAVPVAAVMRKALADLADQSLEKTPNTQLYNMTGCPAISLPLAWGRSGLPIGLQLGAAFGRDGLLFSLGAQLERARPWSGRRPPVCA